MKTLWKDYWLKWNKENVREIYNYISGGMLGGLGACCLSEIRRMGDTSVFVKIAYLVVCLVWMERFIVSCYMKELHLNNMYNLCPMTIKEKRKLILERYLFAGFMSFLFCILADIALAFFLKMPLIGLLPVVINQFMLSFLYLSKEARSKEEKKTIFGDLLLFFGMMTNYILLAFLNDNLGYVLGATAALVIILFPFYGYRFWKAKQKLLSVGEEEA